MIKIEKPNLIRPTYKQPTKTKKRRATQEPETPSWLPFQRPSWFTAGTYVKDPTEYALGPAEEWNQWYRDPSWGGHVEWHPYFGFQDLREIQKLYEENPNVTWQDFMNWGLTPQLSETGEWQKYFPERVTPEGGGNGGGSGGGGGGSVPNVYPGAEEYQLPELSTTDLLQNFGWTGNVGINPYESAALDFINQIYQTQGPLQTMQPAQEFYNQLIGGGFGPESQKYLEDVYGATKTGAMDLLGEMQKGLGERFAHRGGFFGGKHAVAQGELAEGFGQNLSEILANLNLSAFNQDIANRLQAGMGLESLGGSQMNIANQMLGNLLSGGNLITGREMLNRSEWQNAMERAYSDWQRARQEQLMPFNWGLSLLGMQPFQNIVQQPQASPWGNLLGSLGGMIGNLAVPGLGNLLGIPAYQ